MSFERPEFLSQGVFAWDALGYAFATTPPPDLLSATALQSSNPWIRLAAVLERAKNGDFRMLPVLIDCLRQSDSWVLAGACAALLGDSGSAPRVREVVEQFHRELFDEGDLRFQLKIAQTLFWSGLLWTIPIAVEIYLQSSQHRESAIIPILISQMVEENFGPIASPTLLGSESKYHAVVMERYEDLRTKFGTDTVPILYGEIFSIKKLAARMSDHLRADKIDRQSIISQRHRFEAATGVNCQSFYSEGELRPLAANAILEAFLESTQIEKYQDGVRYFFGHRIPD
jgi:hypothetical protein